jgi:hypothetical protein
MMKKLDTVEVKAKTLKELHVRINQELLSRGVQWHPSRVLSMQHEDGEHRWVLDIRKEKHE